MQKDKHSRTASRKLTSEGQSKPVVRRLSDAANSIPTSRKFSSGERTGTSSRKLSSDVQARAMSKKLADGQPNQASRKLSSVGQNSKSSKFEKAKASNNVSMRPSVKSRSNDVQNGKPEKPRLRQKVQRDYKQEVDPDTKQEAKKDSKQESIQEAKQDNRQGSRRETGQEVAQEGRHASSRPSAKAGAKRPSGFDRSQMEQIAKMRSLVVKLFTGILALGCIFGTIFFLRPSTSAIENRNLTEIPPISIETLLNGEYFSGLSLWYADTFPFRDQLVGLDLSLKSLYGVAVNEQMVGGGSAAEEIPEEADSPSKTENEKVEAPNERVMAQEIQDNIMQGLYVKDGAAYSIYYFSDSSVRAYTAAINACAKALEGKANVYSMIVPNNSGAMLSEDVLEELGGSDQAQAIKYFDSLYEDDVVSVDVMDSLREHNNEYIFFRTDHHWTQLGAYYAYLDFCEAAGKKPVSIDSLKKDVYGPFLGSFYAELNNAAMKANPDQVEVFIPKGTNKMRYIAQGETDWTDAKVIQDVTGWNESSLYSTFASGDQPLSKIKNRKIKDGSSILVVKDSFGNALIPWLVDTYEYVYVIDFRYYDGSIPLFVEENDIKDVLFLNNISMAGTTTVADKLASMM